MKRSPLPTIGTPGPRRPTATPRLVATFLPVGRSVSEPGRRQTTIGEAEFRLGPQRCHVEMFEDTVGNPWTRVTPVNALGVIGWLSPEALRQMHHLMLYAFAEELGGAA